MIKKNVNIQNANSLKYEGLAALIVNGQEAAADRHEDFKEYAKERFDKLDAYNIYQNGSIGQAMKEIAELKKESMERKLTCGAAVVALQQKAKYSGIVYWIDSHSMASIILFITSMLASMAIIHTLAKFDLFLKIWLFVKEII